MLGFNKFLKDETAAGEVEMILIIVVLIGVVVIFKSKLRKIVTDIFQTISERAGTI